VEAFTEVLQEFWQSFYSMTFEDKGGFWLILLAVGALALAYLPSTNAAIKRFFKNHPIAWIAIPAILIIYILFMMVGWNNLISGADFEEAFDGVWWEAIDDVWYDAESISEFQSGIGGVFFSYMFNATFGGASGFLAALVWVILMVLPFRPKIRKALDGFFDRHPLIWICIPAALLIYFVYVSLGWNLWVSVSDWQDGELQASYGFGGFGNYTKLFTSEEFWPTLGHTLLLFAIIPLCLVLGLGLALLMDQGLKGTAVFRTLIVLPFALSFVVTGTVWAYMYRPTGGVINSILETFGVDINAAIKSGSLKWASDNDTVMISIIIAMIWQFSGYVAVVFFAAIKNVPVSHINAAKLDGAYMPRIYVKLIIPQLKGAMGSCITILAMYALRSFDFIVSLVGYTNKAATTLPIMMYNEAFQKNNFAYSAAISCFLLALVLILILPLTYWTNKRK